MAIRYGASPPSGPATALTRLASTPTGSAAREPIRVRLSAGYAPVAAAEVLRRSASASAWSLTDEPLSARSWASASTSAPAPRRPCARRRSAGRSRPPPPPCRPPAPRAVADFRAPEASARHHLRAYPCRMRGSRHRTRRPAPPVGKLCDAVGERWHAVGKLPGTARDLRGPRADARCACRRSAAPAADPAIPASRAGAAAASWLVPWWSEEAPDWRCCAPLASPALAPRHLRRARGDIGRRRGQGRAVRGKIVQRRADGGRAAHGRAAAGQGHHLVRVGHATLLESRPAPVARSAAAAAARSAPLDSEAAPEAMSPAPASRASVWAPRPLVWPAIVVEAGRPATTPRTRPRPLLSRHPPPQSRVCRPGRGGRMSAPPGPSAHPRERAAPSARDEAPSAASLVPVESVRCPARQLRRTARRAASSRSQACQCRRRPVGAVGELLEPGDQLPRPPPPCPRHVRELVVDRRRSRRRSPPPRASRGPR